MAMSPHEANHRLKRRRLWLVCVILGIIGSVAVAFLHLTRILDPTGRVSLAEWTKMRIKGVEHGFELFALDHDGKLPVGKGHVIFKELSDPGKDKKGEQQLPYISRNPKDGWGTPLNYEYPSPRFPDGKRPAIWSNGPNGINEQGDGDDIGNWHE